MTKYTINFADGSSAFYNGHQLEDLGAGWTGWFRIMQHSDPLVYPGWRTEVVRFNGTMVKSIEKVALDVQSGSE